MRDIEDEFNTILDSFIKACDAYVQLSLKVREGSMSADVAVQTYDAYLAPVVMGLMILDGLRGPNALLKDNPFMMPPTADQIEDEVAKFRDQLGGL